MGLHPIQLPVFQGPLDLLLQLIEREELDVTAVALAQVTDQYLATLAELEQRETRHLADFLVVAAKLVLIKSIALLPRPSRPFAEDESRDIGQDLVMQLQVYKQFKEIAGALHRREMAGLRTFVRSAVPRRPAPDPDLDEVTLADLLSIAQEALAEKPGPPVGEVVSPISVTIEDQIEHIERELRRQRQIGFRALLSHATSRLEVIVTLWAVLELIKRDRICVRQIHPFGPILLERSAQPPPPPPAVASQ
jgi:segregation and condensation protein A